MHDLIEKAYACAKQILTDNYEKVETLAKLLLEREVIFTEDVQRILGDRPFKTESQTENPDTPSESEPASSEGVTTHTNTEENEQ